MKKYSLFVFLAAALIFTACQPLTNAPRSFSGSDGAVDANPGDNNNGGYNNGNGSQSPSVTSVTVSPSTATVSRGGVRQFSATVNGTNSPAQTVTWSISGGVAGTSISASGLLTVSSSQSTGSLTVIAISTVDTSKSGTATVTVTTSGTSTPTTTPPATTTPAPATTPTPPTTPSVIPTPAPATPTITSVTVSPSTAAVEIGGSQQFSATVSGTNNPAQTVNWSVTGGGTGTSISSSGLLTVGSSQSAGSLTVRATSTVDTSKSGTATVTVTAPPTKTLSSIATTKPARTTYNIGESLKTAGMVVTATYSDGSTAAVTGYTTSGFDSSSAGTKTVTVTYEGKTATFTVTVTPAPKTLSSIAVTTLPNKTTYNIGEPLNTAGMVVTATYSDGSREAVSGYSTSWPSFSSAGTKTLTVEYEYISATFTVEVVSVAGVTVSPSTSTVIALGNRSSYTRQFNAEVIGTNNPPQTVKWTVTGGTNSSINGNGILTVNVSETAKTLTVRATSTVDTTKSGTATVTIDFSSLPSPGSPTKVTQAW